MATEGVSATGPAVTNTYITYKTVIRAINDYFSHNTSPIMIGDLLVTKEMASDVAQQPIIDAALKKMLKTGEATKFIAWLKEPHKKGDTFKAANGDIKISKGGASVKAPEAPKVEAAAEPKVTPPSETPPPQGAEVLAQGSNTQLKPARVMTDSGAAFDALMSFVLGIGTSTANAATPRKVPSAEEVAAMKKGGIKKKDAIAMGMSETLFDIMDKNMDPTGKADGVISAEDGMKAVNTVLLYASTYGMSEEDAYGLYQNAKTFSVKDLSAIRAARSGVISGLGITAGMTYQEILDKIPDIGCRNALKDFILARLSADLSKKPAGENKFDVLCARISALPLISQLDPDLQIKFFNISIPLKPFTGEPTVANILEYLTKGYVSVQANLGGDMQAAVVPGEKEFFAAAYEAGGTTRKKDISPSQYQVAVAGFLTQLDARATALRTKAAVSVLSAAETQEFLRIVAYQIDFGIYSTDNKNVADNIVFLLEQKSKFGEDAVKNIAKAFAEKIYGWMSKEDIKAILNPDEFESVKRVVIAYNKAVGETKGIPLLGGEYITEKDVDEKILRIVQAADANKDKKVSAEEHSEQLIAYLGPYVKKEDSEGSPLPEDELKKRKEVAFVLSVRLNDLFVRNRQDAANFWAKLASWTKGKGPLDAQFVDFDKAVKFIDSTLKG